MLIGTSLALPVQTVKADAADGGTAAAVQNDGKTEQQTPKNETGEQQGEQKAPDETQEQAGDDQQSEQNASEEKQDQTDNDSQQDPETNNAGES